MAVNSFFGTAVLLVSIFATSSRALVQTYCSHQNTGAGVQPTYNQYQSNGACFDTCKASYAFAIVQNSECWCSNYIPIDQESVSLCNLACPGYGLENCGSTSASLYGYVALSIAPSGTAGVSQATTSSTSSSQTSTSQQTTSSSTVQTTSASSTSSQSGSSASLTPQVSTMVVTISGAIVTQTVTSTPQPASTNSSAGVSQTPVRKNVASAGVIAGAVVGSIAGLALIFLILLFLLRRRRNSRGQPSNTGLNRNVSVLSRAGLLSSAHAQDAEKTVEEPQYGYGSQRQSVLYNDDPQLPTGAPVANQEAPQPPMRRNSKPLTYDQRLNPAALMQNWQLNGSKGSVNTMHDQQDYSRPLGITNPDPEHD